MTPGGAVGGCRLVRELGRGGVGVVWEAVDEAAGMRVALKLLHAADARVRERFRAELRALSTLQHPNVAIVHRAGEDQGRPFLVMRLVEGGSLRERILRGGPLEQREAAAIGVKLARALAHAHAQGVLHRDLKPANVLLDRQGEPILADFGLARVVAGAAGPTRTGELLGTPAYMSPEQAEGERGAIDERSDVYGLGTILYEMLSGRPPFSGESLVNQIHAVLSERPTPPRALRALPLDPALEALCLRCLEKDPAARPPSATALGDALAEWLERSAPRPRRARDGGRGTVAAALVVGGLLGAAAVVVVARGRPPDPAAVLPSSASVPSAAAPSPAVAARAASVAEALAAWDGERALDLIALGVARGTALERARALDLCGRFEEAQAVLRREVLEDPGSSTAERYEALLLIGRMIGPPAPYYEQATQLDPDRHEAWARLGLARFYQGNVAGAEACFTRALVLAPDAPEALRCGAQLAWERGKKGDVDFLSEAERLYRQAIALDEHDAEAWALLAWSYRDWPGQARLDEARVAFERAWTLRQPPHPPREEGTHFERRAREMILRLERSWDPVLYSTADGLLSRAVQAEGVRHCQARGLRCRAWRIAIEQGRLRVSPEQVRSILKELKEVYWINPFNLESVRETHLLLALRRPASQAPGEQGAPSFVNALERLCTKFFPDHPDVIKAHAALTLEASTPAKAEELLLRLRALGRWDEEAEAILARIRAR